MAKMPQISPKDRPKKKMGGPRKEIDWVLFEKISKMPITQEDIAWLLSVSVDTLVTRVQEKYNLTLSDYLDKNKAELRRLLHGKQIEVAMKGNVGMLIWLGKQHLKQSEKIEEKSEQTVKQDIVFKTQWGNSQESDNEN